MKGEWVLCWVQWDKSGRIIGRRYRPLDPADVPLPVELPRQADQPPVRRGGIPGRHAQISLFGADE